MFYNVADTETVLYINLQYKENTQCCKRKMNSSGRWGYIGKTRVHWEPPDRLMCFMWFIRSWLFYCYIYLHGCSFFIISHGLLMLHIIAFTNDYWWMTTAALNKDIPGSMLIQYTQKKIYSWATSQLAQLLHCVLFLPMTFPSEKRSSNMSPWVKSLSHTSLFFFIIIIIIITTFIQGFIDSSL